MNNDNKNSILPTSAHKKARHFFLCIVVLSFVFEFLHVHWPTFSNVMSILGNLFVASLCIPIIVELFLKASEKRCERKIPAKNNSDEEACANINTSNEGEHTNATVDSSVNPFYGLLCKAGSFTKILFNDLRNSKLVSFLLVAALVIIVPSVSAKCRVFGRVINAIVEMRYSVIDTQDEIQTGTEKSSTEAPIDSEYIIPDPSSLASPAFLTDPNRYFELSEDEHDKLYFLSGPYSITDWNDTDSVVRVLGQYISDLLDDNLPNYFDEFAPEYLRTQVDRASDLEKTLSNSEQLGEVIDARRTAWAEYPKYGLAKLLAADHHQYALEYYKVNGAFETIEYYCAYSIGWLFESLRFAEVDNYMAKDILASLKMRYHDIAHVAPYGSQKKYYATTIFQALEILENNINNL